ncbi:MAG: carbamate kinase [Spirochaetes bacterium]|nr:MAG: carbamate kinase [Spirochaetota bacterium]
MEIQQMSKNRTAVVALGGNAIIQKGETGDIHQQFANTRKSMKEIFKLIKKGYKVILTHGNGPQVGNLMLMGEKARDILPEIPLGVADAMTAGSMGYMLEQSLQNLMIDGSSLKKIVIVPSQILVDRKDPALTNPTKPIGPFYTAEEAEALRKEKGWVIKEDAGRGYRRYVPSPYPLDIVEKDAIITLLDNDYVVITGGGGGIPVYKDEQNHYEGIDCVIDKDLASMKIALAVQAEDLIIITGVPAVMINFGKEEQMELSSMTLAEAKYYHAQGQFPTGSMGPKILAAIEFVQANPENRVIITDVENLKDAVEGRAGTIIKAY